MSAEDHASPDAGAKAGVAASRRGPGLGRLALVVAPLALFAGLVGIFAGQILSGRDSSEIPSVLIGTPAPQQTFPPLPGLAEPDGTPVPGVSIADLRGEPAIVNVFASWCAPCRVEHPLLMELAETAGVAMIGINYKDDPARALAFLAELGNPYDGVGVDREGRQSIDWGLYGVPETFLINAEGEIVHKVVGPVTRADLEGAFGDKLRALAPTPGS